MNWVTSDIRKFWKFAWASSIRTYALTSIGLFVQSFLSKFKTLPSAIIGTREVLMPSLVTEYHLCFRLEYPVVLEFHNIAKPRRRWLPAAYTSLIPYVFCSTLVHTFFALLRHEYHNVIVNVLGLSSRISTYKCGGQYIEIMKIWPISLRKLCNDTSHIIHSIRKHDTVHNYWLWIENETFRVIFILAVHLWWVVQRSTRFASKPRKE